MDSVIDDVLRFIEHGVVDPQWVWCDNYADMIKLDPRFLEELDLQEQINETEMDDPSFLGDAT